MAKKRNSGPDIGKQDAPTNLFGGKNAHGLYVPMSEDEQEVLHRLVEAENIALIIHGWGRLDRPKLLVGDHRVGVQFRLTFHKPANPTPVYFFDLELQTRTGITLVKERLPVVYNGKPIQVQAGMFLELQWDIAIHSMDPRLVRLLKPGARGLTSRRQDRDTGQMTAQGNMRLDARQRAALHELESGFSLIRSEDGKKIIQITQAAGYQVKKTARGVEAPDLED